MNEAKTKRNIHAGHRDRMKERYLESGPDGFASHELLELLLFYGIPQKDTNELAHKMIDRFGSLEGVLSASPAELMTVPGIKKHAAVLISLATEINRRSVIDKFSKRQLLDTQTKIEKFLIPLFSNLSAERFYALYLDNSLRLIKYICISEGSVNATISNVRKIVEHALYNNAASVILAHNHPGGIPIPSRGDVSATHDIDNSLRLLQINLIEHFVVAGDKCVPLIQNIKERRV